MIAIPDSVKSFWSNHKKTIIVIGAVLLALLLGYGGGRYAQPAKVVEKEKIVTQIQEKVVYQDRIVTQKVLVEVEKKRVHRETTTTKKPDGEVVTTTKVDTNTDTDTKDNESKVEEKVVYKDRIVQQVVEKEKLVLRQPDWRIAAGVGVSIPHYLGQPDVGVSIPYGLVIQAEADRRILGPVWLGVFGNTQGTAGLMLSAVF
jgi:hypothetical protein